MAATNTKMAARAARSHHLPRTRNAMSTTAVDHGNVHHSSPAAGVSGAMFATGESSRSVTRRLVTPFLVAMMFLFSRSWRTNSTQRFERSHFIHLCFFQRRERTVLHVVTFAIPVTRFDSIVYHVRGNLELLGRLYAIQGGKSGSCQGSLSLGGRARSGPHLLSASRPKRGVTNPGSRYR